MSLVLSLETSTDVCSVALHEKNVLLANSSIDEPQAHAARLAPLIQDLLSSARVKPSALKAIAVSSGPGSYTGLRIGTSTAKGLCFGLSIPLISIPTLKVLACEGAKASRPGELLCPMIDARRMEVYCQIFDGKLAPLTDVEARILDQASFGELLGSNKMLFFGNGAEKAKRLATDEARFADNIFPSAIAVGELAWQKFQSSDFEDLKNFKPFYLKEFVAKKAQPLL